MDELNIDVEALSQEAVSMTMTYGPKLLLAILTLIIGLWVVNRIVAAARKTLTARTGDDTLAGFMTSLISIVLKILLLISVASMVGIETTSFVAVMGAAGLAVGLALQGSLSNFAGGALILLFRPYRVGDFVEAQGIAGVVKEIQIFNTIMKTGDNKIIIVPNGAISNGIITNYSLEATRRVDMVFGIGYDDDIDQARATLQRLVDADERILKDPATAILLSELADSSVNFTMRAWVNAADYWGVYFDMHENVKKAFDADNISIPYPQSDVHLHQANG